MNVIAQFICAVCSKAREEAVPDDVVASDQPIYCSACRQAYRATKAAQRVKPRTKRFSR